MKGRLIKALILVSWAALMLWWHEAQRLLPPPEKIDAVFLPDYFDAFSLEHKGQKIGWADRSLRREADGSYRAGESFTILVALGGREVEARLEFLADLDSGFNLTKYQCLARLGQRAVVQNGTVTDGRLTVELNLGQYKEMAETLYAQYGHLLGERAAMLNPAPVTLPAPEGPALIALIPHWLAARGLAAGQNVSLPAFDPFTRSLVGVNVKVLNEGSRFDPDSARDVTAFELLISQGPGAPGETLFVTRHGRLMEALAPPAYKVARAADEAAARRGAEALAPPPALTELLANFN